MVTQGSKNVKRSLPMQGHERRMKAEAAREEEAKAAKEAAREEKKIPPAIVDDDDKPPFASDPVEAWALLRSEKVPPRAVKLAEMVWHLEQKDPRGCYASNHYLGRAVGITDKYKVGRCLTLLEKAGVIVRIQHGNQRYLKTTWKSKKQIKKERKKNTSSDGTTHSGNAKNGIPPMPKMASPHAKNGIHNSKSKREERTRETFGLSVAGILPATVSGGGVSFSSVVNNATEQDGITPRGNNKGSHSATKQKGSSPAAIMPIDREWADFLEKELDRRNKLTRQLTPQNRVAWAMQFRGLRTLGKFTTEEIDATLRWHVANIGKDKVPVAYSAKTFVDKFPNIQDAMKRASEDAATEVKVSDEALSIVEAVAHWMEPHNQNRLAPVVQRSIDNHRRWFAILDQKKQEWETRYTKKQLDDQYHRVELERPRYTRNEYGRDVRNGTQKEMVSVNKHAAYHVLKRVWWKVSDCKGVLCDYFQRQLDDGGKMGTMNGWEFDPCGEWFHNDTDQAAMRADVRNLWPNELQDLWTSTREDVEKEYNGATKATA